MNVNRALAYLSLAAALSGCGLFAAKDEPPPPPPPTRVELKIDVAGNINPGADGQPAPLLLRVYELKGLSAFNSADFFALYDKEQATLGADWSRKQEFLLKPGEQRTLSLEPEADVQFIGVFAAYRQLDTALWRASAPVKPHQTVPLELKISGTQLNLKAVEAAPAKP
ncbi:type VI secretion system lipoprotein TssJ [Methylococcus sp. EFPC2]|uniref:type VI secretion system lipoprotein TssJ n=1 Tax=Methylococcus sp. EFPC2 TaxID=2812648 RepID=UPI0019676DCF|nr:type VI secretion system lipoprotein TssJ [Methylococcus sp. EFPC2]QSA96413.1 type VI secretion system lipoprotein TssJ [Methylococcus sp. EFPC2]